MTVNSWWRLPAAVLFCAVGVACSDDASSEDPQAIVDEIGVKEMVALRPEQSEPTRRVSLERLSRVRATGLTPGAAFVDPEIENPFSGDAERIAAGKRHFAAFNCSGCHAPYGGGGMGPSLSDESWIYGDEPEQIYLTLLHGRPAGMPAFSSMLTEDMIWELAAYIETLDDVDNYANAAGFKENRFGYRKKEGEAPNE